MSDFTMITTNLGASAVIDAMINQTEIGFNNGKIVIGDSNGSYYEPSEDQTALVNQVWQGNISDVNVIDSHKFEVEAIIPADLSFEIREIGVLDNNGNLFAVGKYKYIDKPDPTSGTSMEITLKPVIVVASTAVINLTIDPTITIATKEDIDNHNDDETAHSALFALKQNNLDVSVKGNIYTSTSSNTIDVIAPNTSESVRKYLSQLNSETSWEELSQPACLPYSVNSGNQDVNGYADLMAKGSDTEITFKVDDGTTYAPMLTTYPNGFQENLTSLQNISDITDDGLYKILKKPNSDAFLVKLGYISSETSIPAMTSNSMDGYIASASTESQPAYQAFNGLNRLDNDSDYWSALVSGFSKTLGIQLPEARIMQKYAITTRNTSSGSYHCTPNSWTFEGSNDGSTWTVLDTQTGQFSTNPVNTRLEFDSGNATSYQYYRLSISSGNEGDYIIIGEFELYEYFAGGNITESITAPVSPANGDYWLNIGVKPLKSYKYNGSDWIETQFVKLGEVTKTSGTLGTPVSYAFNGYYDSKWFSVSTSNSYYKYFNVGCDVQLDLYVSTSSSGTNKQRVYACVDTAYNETFGAVMVNTTKLSARIRTGSNDLNIGRGNNFNGSITSGYYQLIAKRSF